MKLKSILFMSFGLLSLGNSYGQSYVTTGTTKYTLVEEGTGAWCQYCPDGSQQIQEKIEPTYPHAVIASFHDDYGGIPAADGMTLPGNPYNDSTGYITGFPKGTVDRAVVGSAVGLDRTQWFPAVGTRDVLTPNFKVTMISTYDSATRLVTIKVTGKALVAGTGSWRINAYIVEDSIASVGSGFSQSNNYVSATAMSTTGSLSWYAGYGTPISPATRYSHMNVVRKILGAGIWGTAAFTNPAVGDSQTKTYTYTIPTTSPSKYIKVIGLVQKYGTTTADRAIENCIMARVRTMAKVYPPTPPAGVADVTGKMDNIELAPNPAANYINVQGSLAEPAITKIIITNITGQLIAEKEYPAGGTLFSENISLTNISNGIYFMNIINNGESVTKKFVVNK